MHALAHCSIAHWAVGAYWAVWPFWAVCDLSTKFYHNLVDVLILPDDYPFTDNYLSILVKQYLPELEIELWLLDWRSRMLLLRHQRHKNLVWFTLLDKFGQACTKLTFVDSRRAWSNTFYETKIWSDVVTGEAWPHIAIPNYYKVISCYYYKASKKPLATRNLQLERGSKYNGDFKIATQKTKYVFIDNNC